MAEDYLYDIFISYRHKGQAMEWVRNHFHPLLEQRLPDSLPVQHELSVFIDLDIETGAAWPAKLRQALKNARCLVAVWSPEYFRSDWCLAEWQTMREREKLLGWRSEQNPQGLIYPVVFADGEHFPPEARAVQWRDLRAWNYGAPAFRDTVGFLDFDQQVQKLAGELAGMILTAPAWQDWPVVTPNAAPEVVVKLPRL